MMGEAVSADCRGVGEPRVSPKHSKKIPAAVFVLSSGLASEIQSNHECALRV